MLRAIVDELTNWNPRERMGMFRKWLEGSLSIVQLHVLTVLETAGPLPMGKLADALDVSVASATGIVDRMEQRGLVERRHDEADRRIVLVHPTEIRSRGLQRPRGDASGRPRQDPRPAHERRAEGAARRPPGDVEGSGSPAGRGPGRIRFEPRNGRAQRPAPPGSRGGDDMIGLLRTYLRPYTRTIVLILGLLLVGAIGNLYLPNLQGDIINNGVVKGDTDYILRVGGLMLLVTAVVGVTSIIAVYFSSRVAMGFGRDVRSAIFTKVQSFSQVEVNTLRARVADHPQHERRPAGPAGHLHGDDDHGLGADPDRRRDLHGGPDRRHPVGPAPRDPADHGPRHRPHVRPAHPAVPDDPGEDRPDQPGDARDALGRPRHPGVRPDPPRGGPVRDREPRPLRRPAQGRPDLRRHPAGDLRDLQPLDGRGPVVRRLAGRGRRTCRSAT